MIYLYGIVVAYTIYELIIGYWAGSVLLWSITLIIQAIIIIIKRKKQKTNNQKIINEENSIYHKRELITKCEKEFMTRLNTIFRKKFIIQPQIPLRMIVTKENDKFNKYASELNRYIDYGIFNKSYELQALVELNDKSHELEERKERDLKVQNICKQAKIPLITFWTYEKITNEEIKHRIEKEIENAK